MGRFRPVAAVTSQCNSLADSLASGEDIARLLDRLGVLGPEMVTLQIGSGMGRVEYHLRTRVKRCYGADVSPSMVRQARSLVPFDNVEFVETDGTQLPWPDEYFDLVYSFLVFQHLPREQFYRYLREAFGKLVHGGHLVFQITIDEKGEHRDPPRSHPYGLRHYRRREVEDALKQAGFSLLARTGLDGTPDDGSITTGDIVFSSAKP